MPNDDDFDEEKWVPDEALSFLTEETLLHPEEDSIARAKRLFKENVDTAAASLIWIARNSASERNRGEASKYIMERVLGRAGEAPAVGALDELFDALERLANNEPAMDQSGPHGSHGTPHGPIPND
jgi:hypothetical protein